MGMFTEFYFRADIKNGPVADWLERQVCGEEWFEAGFDDHEFFTLPRWSHVFIGDGAVYQESRRAIFRRVDYGRGYSQLVLASSLKDYDGEIEAFIAWIDPHLKMSAGALLGYSLYEDSAHIGLGWDRDRVDIYREHPRLFFAGCEAVRA